MEEQNFLSVCRDELAYTHSEKHEHLFGFWYAPSSEHMFFLGNTTFYLRVEQMFGFGIYEKSSFKSRTFVWLCGVKNF